jgi:hypothetical protein
MVLSDEGLSVAGIVNEITNNDLQVHFDLKDVRCPPPPLQPVITVHFRVGVYYSITVRVYNLDEQLGHIYSLIYPDLN